MLVLAKGIVELSAPVPKYGDIMRSSSRMADKARKLRHNGNMSGFAQHRRPGWMGGRMSLYLRIGALRPQRPNPFWGISPPSVDKEPKD
jgi:hypothetical protein